jgi:hypothetical protein
MEIKEVVGDLQKPTTSYVVHFEPVRISRRQQNNAELPKPEEHYAATTSACTQHKSEQKKNKNKKSPKRETTQANALGHRAKR